MIFEMGWSMGCLWVSGVAASTFCLPVTLLSHNLCMPSHGQGSCVYWEGVDGCSWGTVHRMSMDHVSGRHGVQCVPHVLHTLQLLQTPQHSRFCRSQAGVIPSRHG